jgi:choline dehydrogenase-like flavoprotein
VIVGLSEFDQAAEIDVCIVGAGPAGITLALELEKRGVRSILLEAGRENSDLYEGEVDPPSTHRSLHLDRNRGLGGSTSAWGGRCIPFDPIDFEERPWVPHSGWPIGFEEVDRFHRQAAEYCEIGDYDFTAESPLIDGFEHPDIRANTLERWSPPTHFGKRFAARLRDSKLITVVTGAAVIRISGEVVEIAGGHELSAKRIVLAGGGLETARLLLHSNIGNHSDWLGRGYMTHRYGIISRVRFSPTAKARVDYERDPDGIPIRRRFTFSSDAQRRQQLLNGYFVIDRPPLADPAHGSSLLSLGYIAKRLLGKHTEPSTGQLSQHLKNLVVDSPALIAALPKFLVQRYFRHHRIPSLLPSSTEKLGYVFYHYEQVPDRKSRITLTDTKDRFGVPRLSVDYRVQDQDVESIVRQHKMLAVALKEGGVGELEFVVDSPADAVRAGEAMYAHHLGATRMSADPEDGVVDPNCQVHGVESVFVASASAFPTSGGANPTLTLLALTIRLAEHLTLPRPAPYG